MTSQTNKIIYSTTDYSAFKRLKGNRRVPRSRVDAIKRSIMDVGYVTSIVIVNEKLEVIDGQGRVAAEEELGLPVEYCIHAGAGIAECRAMNLKQTNWTLRDFIESYAEDGYTSYEMLLELLNKYQKIGLNAIYNAVTGLDGTNNSAIKEGKFEMDGEQKTAAEDILNFEARFTSIVAKLRGSKDSFYMALGFAYGNESVDNEKLFNSINSDYAKLSSISNKADALDEISRIYNYHVKGANRIYLRTDYERMLNKQYTWYQKKWGDRA